MHRVTINNSIARLIKTIIETKEPRRHGASHYNLEFDINSQILKSISLL